MKIYICVTRDKYEHIIEMADTAPELARLCGVSKGAVEASLVQWRKGRWSRYQEVKI